MIDEHLKTIFYYERHLYPHIQRKLNEGNMSPYDVKYALRFNETMHFLLPDDLRLKHRLRVYRRNYRVVFVFKNKIHLIIFNKWNSKK